MRLIDAEVVKEFFRENLILPYEGHKKIVETMIDAIPTACCIDKVIEQLEEKKNNLLSYSKSYENIGDFHMAEIYSERLQDYSYAIEIVKQGCVSDDVCEWKHSERFRGMETLKTGCCGKTMILTALEAGDIECSTQYAMKYCPYCGKKVKMVE